MIRPPKKLSPGDKVRVVAPAGPVPRDAFMAGVGRLGGRYQLVYDERLFARTGYLAGDDAARLNELAQALADPDARAIVCARGGYGLMRIVAALGPVRSPKLIVGFSDVTVLHAWAFSQGVMSVHGPV